MPQEPTQPQPQQQYPTKQKNARAAAAAPTTTRRPNPNGDDCNDSVISVRSSSSNDEAPQESTTNQHKKPISSSSSSSIQPKSATATAVAVIAIDSDESDDENNDDPPPTTKRTNNKTTTTQRNSLSVERAATTTTTTIAAVHHSASSSCVLLPHAGDAGFFDDSDDNDDTAAALLEPSHIHISSNNNNNNSSSSSMSQSHSTTVADRPPRNPHTQRIDRDDAASLSSDSSSSSNDTNSLAARVAAAVAHQKRRRHAAASETAPAGAAFAARQPSSKDDSERLLKRQKSAAAAFAQPRKASAAAKQTAAALEKQQHARDPARHQKEATRALAALEKDRVRRAKTQQTEAAAQAAGKHCRAEIAVLLPLDVFAASSNNKKYATLVPELEQQQYLVQDCRSAALSCNAVQWIRKDAALGGAKAAVHHWLTYGAPPTKGPKGSSGELGYQHLPVVAIVVDDPIRFIRLLERNQQYHTSASNTSNNNNGSNGGDDNNNNNEWEDDYPALETWLKGIECGWRAAWAIPNDSSSSSRIIGDNNRQPQRPRLVLLLDRVLETLDKLWIEHRKSAFRTANPPPTAEELQDAIIWIMIQFQVDCVHCTCPEDITTHVRKMTRLLAEEPYRRIVTNLDCIQKLRPECSDQDPPAVRAQDCWFRQLQQMPRVSRTMAESLIQYYPTARSLYRAYTDDSISIGEKEMLTANMFAYNKTHSKVSNQLYSYMMSTDASERID